MAKSSVRVAVQIIGIDGESVHEFSALPQVGRLIEMPNPDETGSERYRVTEIIYRSSEKPSVGYAVITDEPEYCPIVIEVVSEDEEGFINIRFE